MFQIWDSSCTLQDGHFPILSENPHLSWNRQSGPKQRASLSYSIPHLCNFFEFRCDHSSSPRPSILAMFTASTSYPGQTTILPAVEPNNIPTLDSKGFTIVTDPATDPHSSSGYHLCLVQRPQLPRRPVHERSRRGGAICRCEWDVSVPFGCQRVEGSCVVFRLVGPVTQLTLRVDKMYNENRHDEDGVGYPI
jgi:hypothetical protein